MHVSDVPVHQVFPGLWPVNYWNFFYANCLPCHCSSCDTVCQIHIVRHNVHMFSEAVLLSFIEICLDFVEKNTLTSMLLAFTLGTFLLGTVCILSLQLF